MITARETIAALGHDLVKTEAVAPTSEEPGNTEYWTCTACGKYFSDAEGKNEIAKDSWIIPATGPNQEEIEKAEAAEALSEEVTDAKAISNADGKYTAESYQALQDAIAEAERVAADSSSTAAQLRAALAAVEAAKAGLVEVPTQEEIEKAEAAEALNEAVTAAKAVSNANGKYTAESYKALQDAIAEAERVAADSSSTAEQLKAAMDAVEAVQKALKAAAPKVVRGGSYVVSGQSYIVTNVATSAAAGTVTFTKARNAKAITVPGYVTLADGKNYNVTIVGAKAFIAPKIRTVTIDANVIKITKGAFTKSKATKVIIKTKRLKKSSVKGSLKSSKVKTVQIKVGNKKANKTFLKKYKKYFTRANAGRKVTVK